MYGGRWNMFNPYDANDKFMGGNGYAVGSYDGNGNPSWIQPAQSRQTFQFDFESRLTQIVYSPGPAPNTFRFNGDGMRVEKVDSSGTARYVYDGNSIIAETDGSGSVTQYDTPGVGWTTAAGATYYFMEDALGDTDGVQDAGLNVTDWYGYTAYGGALVFRQGVYTPYKFKGKHGYYADGDSGMLLLGHRYFLPSLQRFLTQDPTGHDAGLNLYEYAASNPLRNTDPSGLDWDIGPSGHPWLSFSWHGTGEGLATAGAALGHSASLGLWDGGRWRNEPGFEASSASWDVAGAALGGAAGLAKAAAAEGTAQVVRTGTELVVRNRITEHMAARMAERGVSRDMAMKAIEKGAKYWDRAENTIAHVLEGGTAGGKSLYVATDRATGNVVTGMIRRRFNAGTLLADGGPRWVAVK